MKNKSLIISLFLLIFLLLVFLVPKAIFLGKLQQAIVPVNITPDHAKTLAEIVITIPYQPMDERDVLVLLENHYQNLLLAIPSYSKLDIFTHKNNFEAVEKFLKHLNLKNEREYHLSENKNLELWAQDYFEPVIKMDNGGKTDHLLMPKKNDKHPAFQRIANRNAALEKFRNNLNATFFFEGGNLTATTKNNESFVFTDFETIKKTLDSYLLTGHDLAESTIKKLLKKTFPTAKVAVLGDIDRSDNFIHLDQSVLFLEQGTVIVHSLEETSETKAAKQHSLYKTQLEDLGFKVKTLAITQVEIENSISYLNAIPFKDKESGKNKVIFPIYQDDLRDVNKKSSLTRNDLQNTGLVAFELFESVGYEPIPVLEDSNYKQNGSIHCITNVLK